MGIFSWFSRSPEEDQPPRAEAPGSSEGRSAEVGGLNFKSAVDAHMKWKIRLEAYINGTSDEELQVDVICRDDRCPLGKWIYGRGSAEFGYSETFFDMKAHHAHFHRCAGDVLAAAQAGEKKQALQLLHSGDYVRASERVKKLLARLFVLVADGQTAIDAHVRWKERLHDHITGNGEDDLPVDAIGRDDQCTLGFWLDGEGQEHHGHLPEFAQVRAAHTHFHRCAAEVLTTAHDGQREKALHMLEEGDYAQASENVTAALVNLFNRDK
jgi:hypothetical protein